MHYRIATLGKKVPDISLDVFKARLKTFLFNC